MFLPWYDYGARFYDAQIARFHSVDLLAEVFSFQSPYAYAANNPIYYIDYMGLGPKEWWESIKGWINVIVRGRTRDGNHKTVRPEREEREVVYSERTIIKPGLNMAADLRWGTEVSINHSFDESFRSNVLEQGIVFNRHENGLQVSQERIYRIKPKTILIADDPRRTRVLSHIMRFLGLNMGNRINVSLQGAYPVLDIPEPTDAEREFLMEHNLPFYYSVGHREIHYQRVLRVFGTRAYFEELERAGIIETQE